MKIDSAHQIEVRHAKEQRELAKRLKALEKPAGRLYFPILVFMLSIVYIVDEITSSMTSSVQSEVVTEFFVNGMGLDFNTGLASFTAMSAPMMALMMVAPFYKALADRFGRKVFLIINTIAMGVGMTVCMFATNVYVFIVGMFIINFVIPNDMQVMYIMECAPEKHRAKLCSITKAIGLLGVTLIPVLRGFFMGNDGSKWREIYLIPVICALGVGFIALFFLRETPVFLNERAQFLRMTDEERAAKAAAEKKTQDDNKGGVIKAIKFIFGHKQTRAIAISAMLIAAAAGVTSYYESIMKTGGMDTAQITSAMYFFPFCNALMTAIGGFITDAIGRKRSAVLLSIIAFLGLGMFIVSSNLGFAPYIVGICYGFFLGGLWSVSDLLFLILPGESTPTQLRASVIGTMSLMLGIGMGLSTVVITVGMLFVKSIGTLCLFVCLPFMIVSIIILITKVHETKGRDLNTITGTEWD